MQNLNALVIWKKTSLDIIKYLQDLSVSFALIVLKAIDFLSSSLSVHVTPNFLHPIFINNSIK
ncbi:hypothetical protein [Eremococcus coleocola]|uniref:Uncharacterized protein n=1 Tax=Eremococcus coleocola ACS-139-V-Col8 TaxID=908337 RepID=E4KQ62_9LACT|nr:hypothetical protein [Eremococcus coleocola]EFR30916.1 hypothetical protein HMPREF9257_1660 [Eremococcus coleocola ACS-139-V-Col8]